jgi:phosphoribosylanthranilate isomerase
MVRIKICGVTNVEDASMVVSLGADAVGFIFAQSPRQVTPEKVRNIIDTLPPFVQTVGVFVDEDGATIRDIMNFCALDMVQLHGTECPELCRSLMPYTIKAFHLRDESSLLSVERYRKRARALLLDTYQKGKKGGTGKAFDWNLALRVRQLGFPVILSGGLGPQNIRRAISIVRPYAIDVNSGIELQPGIKSHILMKEVIETVRRMNLGGPSCGYSRILR